MLIYELAILSLAFLLRLIIACPADKIAYLLQFSGSITMIKVCREQPVLFLQRGEFRIKAVDVPNDIFPFHTRRIRHSPALNKSPNSTNGAPGAFGTTRRDKSSVAW